MHACDPLRPPWDPCPCLEVEPDDAYLDAVVESGPPEPEPERCVCGQPLAGHRPRDVQWRYRRNGEA